MYISHLCAALAHVDSLRMGVWYVCLFSVLDRLKNNEGWGDVLEGCFGWFCSLTNEVEVGAALSSQGAW